METTKKLGFGMMRLPLTDPEDKKSVDIEKTKEMVDLFIQRGFTYFDTAWMYCAFQSECVVKEVLTDRYPRDSFTLADKLHAGYLTCPEDRDRIFAEQKRKTGVDYFDYYLLHSLNADLYGKLNQYDCFNWLKAKKEAGEVKEMGFSFHDSPEMLETILREHPEMDFVQLQINYLDWESQEVESRRCYEVARKYGKPIVVMEPVK
ncbi:MAG: aldo/keto reductase, partial [Clostridia bacterium]|nr:aldo/keto reductase [Clostridia bacterium]